MRRSIIILALVFLFAGLAYFFRAYLPGLAGSGGGPKIINNFEDCATAGYPVGESYPRQCKTPDGRTFTEDVSSSVTPTPGTACENLCGDGICQEIVCEAVGCPCSEDIDNCPIDCSGELHLPEGFETDQ